MLRSTASKVMWVGRATVFLVGLAVILALIFGVASTAFGHAGSKGLFHLGHNNAVRAISTLAKSGAGPALSLRVGSGAPLAVNSSTKVANLNSDQVDGRDAPMWAVVNSDGSIPRSSDAAILSFQTGEVGLYDIEFPRNVSQCGYEATIGGGFVGLTNASSNAIHPNRVRVGTLNTSGQPVDKGFHLLVTC